MEENESCVLCLDVVKRISSSSTAKVKRKSLKSGSNIGQLYGSDLVENEVAVVFIVRKLLSIPSHKCEELLETFGNPSSWVITCDKCSQLISDARKVLERIKALEKDLERKREEIKEKVISSSQDECSVRRRKVKIISEAAAAIRNAFILQTAASTIRGNRMATFPKSPPVVVPPEEQVKQELPDPDYFPDDDNNYDDDGDAILSGDDDVEVNDGPTNDEAVEHNDSSSDVEITTKAKIGGIVQSLNLKRNINRIKSRLSKKTGTTKRGNRKFKPQEGESVFKCHLCTDYFKTKVYLHKHLNMSHSVFKYNRITCPEEFKARSCRRCRIRFRTWETFRDHCVNVHSMLECPHCPRLFSRFNQFKGHVTCVHNGDVSNYRSREVSAALEKDMKIIFVGDVQLFQCIHCNYCSKTKTLLNNHMYKVHRNKYFKDDTKATLTCEKCFGTGTDLKFSSLDELNNHKITAHEMVKCEECSTLCIGIGYLENHVKAYHSAETADPMYWIRRNSSIQKKRELSSTVIVGDGGKKISQCKFCNETFERRSQLTTHNLKEHPEEMFKCDKCPELFDILNHLYSHKTKVHSEPDNPYKCPLCDYTHLHYSQVHGHRKRVHEQRTRVVCEICSDTFATEKYLRSHKAQKHGEDNNDVNVICGQCNRSFSCPAYLKRHVTTVHDGEWRFRCPLCGIGFMGKKEVDRHVNSFHKKLNPFACEVEGCSKKYSTNYQLKEHMKRSHGPRTNKCSTCDYACADPGLLKRHEANHEKGFHQCEQCGKSYTTLKCFYQHLRLAHKIVTRRVKKQVNLSPFIASIEAKKNCQDGSQNSDSQDGLNDIEIENEDEEAFQEDSETKIEQIIEEESKTQNNEQSFQ